MLLQYVIKPGLNKASRLKTAINELVSGENGSISNAKQKILTKAVA